MDLLDRVLVPATDLLGRVDATLVRFGAPAGHPVWHQLTRAGTLPSPAVAQVAALAPDQLRSLSEQLTTVAVGLRTTIDAVPSSLTSRGHAADAGMATWRELAAQIGTADGGLAARISTTAAQLDDVADWASAARRGLAGELGACLGCAEAVQVRSAGGRPDADSIAAAADIAARVLGSVSELIDDGWHRFARWSGLAVETPVTGARAWDLPVGQHIELA